MERRLPNDLSVTLQTLEPYRSTLTAIAVESTFNWYWLVDGLMEAGYEVKLVNTSAVRQYDGLKHSDDRDDAFHLAHLLRLGILPTGYIYPKQQRAVRDLLRQRGRLVQQRTMHVLNVKSTYARALNLRVSGEALNGDSRQPWPSVADPHTAMAIYAHRPVIQALNAEIKRIEKAVRRELIENTTYVLLQSVPGIGPILAWIVLLETGDIQRFSGPVISRRTADACRRQDQQWQEEKRDQQKERQPVFELGLSRSRALRGSLYAAGQALLRAQIATAQSHGGDPSDRAQTRACLLLHFA